MSMQCSAQSWLASDFSNLVSTCILSTFSCSDCLLGLFSCFQLPTSNCFCDVFQAQGANGAKLRYTGMTDVLRKTVQADGFKGLYRVSSPSYQPLQPHITAVSAFFGGKVLLLFYSQAACTLECSQQWSGFLVVTTGFCSITAADMRGIAQCCQTCQRVCTLCALDGEQST